MALPNKLSASAFLRGSTFSSTSRLRRTWNPSALKFMPAGWRSHSAQISGNKPMAQAASDAAQESAISSRIYTQGERILWVDLIDKIEYGIEEVVHYPPKVARKENPGDISGMMKQLKQFVKEDMMKAPSERIDSVVLYPAFPGDPTAKMWRVLDGLSPKHLEIFAPKEYEECYIRPLNALKHQWNNLESLTLHNICQADLMKCAPKVLSQISSLTLDHCRGTEYFPPAVTRLKHLRVLENSACDAFNYGANNIPNFAEALEVLEIESTDGYDCWDINDPQGIKDHLQKCTNLREFRLAAGYVDNLDNDLASYIPPSVEKLTLHFTRSLLFLHDIGDWTKHASDPTWLPHLKSFQLTVDPESCVRGLQCDVNSLHWTRNLENPPVEFSREAFDMEFERKRRLLYDVLRFNRPFIDLLT